MTPQEVINKKTRTINNYSQNGFNTLQLNELLEEYGKQQWNEAIKLAAEEAELVKYTDCFGDPASYIDKESILKLLKP